jgi:hypothetical protein
LILIYTLKESKRLTYILKFLFNDIHGTDFQLITNRDEFISSTLPKINYSDEALGEGIQIMPDNLLFESDILQKQILV